MGCFEELRAEGQVAGDYFFAPPGPIQLKCVYLKLLRNNKSAASLTDDEHVKLPI